MSAQFLDNALTLQSAAFCDTFRLSDIHAFLLSKGNLVAYVAFGGHVVFVFDSLLWGKGSDFCRFKQETEKLVFKTGGAVGEGRISGFQRLERPPDMAIPLKADMEPAQCVPSERGFGLVKLGSDPSVPKPWTKESKSGEIDSYVPAFGT